MEIILIIYYLIVGASTTFLLHKVEPGIGGPLVMIIPILGWPLAVPLCAIGFYIIDRKFD